MADETPETDETSAPDAVLDEASAEDAAATDDTAEAASPVEDIPVTGPTATSTDDGAAAKATKTDKATKAAKAAKPEATVVRKKVTSKRVTPKGSPQGVKATSSTAAKTKAKASEDDDEPAFSKRYTPPKATYAPGPSPWWVPALMFGLLIIGALVIMLNYMGVFGDAQNIRLVIGLAFILGGIITATQYR